MRFQGIGVKKIVLGFNKHPILDSSCYVNAFLSDRLLQLKYLNLPLFKYIATSFI